LCKGWYSFKRNLLAKGLFIGGSVVLINDLMYQDGDYWCYYDKKAECFIVCKDGLVCSSIIGHASTFEQAKESIEWHKQEE